ncbi:hypothetical protein MTO96_011143 [Rhipicephalus appendiculatus]
MTSYGQAVDLNPGSMVGNAGATGAGGMPGGHDALHVPVLPAAAGQDLVTGPMGRLVTPAGPRGVPGDRQERASGTRPLPLRPGAPEELPQDEDLCDIVL